MSTARSSSARLERVLAMIPWILAHPGTTIAELAQRFEVGEADLEQDLELLPMCGLPPYTADRLIDVWVSDEGGVEVRLAEYFERPLRLTPAEGVALVAAGRALLTVPGAEESGPLATAIEKLEKALGAAGGVAVDVGGTANLERLQQAVAAGEQLEIEYYSFARDEMTTRVIDPVRVFHAFGAWYLAAYCHRVEDDRLFRVDRVRSICSTGQTVAPRDRAKDGDTIESVYQPAPSDLRVKLRLEPDATWVAESVPVESAKPGARGRMEVVIAISAPAFLERLLLALGTSARVLSPPSARQLAKDAAARVRARYDAA